MSASKRNYDLTAGKEGRQFAAPRLPYQPPSPKRYRPKIGLIGCGGISPSHLRAYRSAAWDVVALCNRSPAAAEARRDEFYPKAEVLTDYHDLLARPDVDVVDITLHPEPRVEVIEAALRAGKHVLSQKPFVLDLNTGKRLITLARKKNRHLAVNQNGRWSPYFSYLNQVVRTGRIGTIQSVSMRLNWDHTWIKGTPFEKIPQLVLADFGIHWFDMTALLFKGRKARSVFATATPTSSQTVKPPMLATASIAFDQGLATLHFDAHSPFDPSESILITGSEGTLRAEGPICAAHNLTLTTKRGIARPKLEGQWFDDGFRGAMGELLCAIEEDREPSNTAATCLPGLAICFAAIESVKTKQAVTPDPSAWPKQPSR